MSDLTAFLLARIAEDEAAANGAGGEDWYPMLIPPASMSKYVGEPQHTIIDSPKSLISYEVVSAEVGEHIARHDPERVLRECEAKRRLLSDHHSNIHRCDGGDMTWDDLDCTVKVTLATIYDDHPDYREEWRPVREPIAWCARCGRPMAEGDLMCCPTPVVG